MLDEEEILPIENHIHRQSQLTLSVGRSKLRDSVVSLSAVSDRPALEALPSSDELLKPPKQRRFSLLRFRNASDSQLSRTAKEQASKRPCIPGLS